MINFIIFIIGCLTLIVLSPLLLIIILNFLPALHRSICASVAIIIICRKADVKLNYWTIPRSLICMTCERIMNSGTHKAYDDSMKVRSEATGTIYIYHFPKTLFSLGSFETIAKRNE